MTGTLGAISREYRELLLNILTPIPLLSVILALLIITSKASSPVYLLVYSMLLSTLLIHFRRVYSVIASSIREAREYREPSLDDIDSMGIWEQIVASKDEFFRAKEIDLEHISNHENESIVPNATFAALSLGATFLAWQVLTSVLAGTIVTGLFQAFINTMDQSLVAKFSRVLSESSIVVFVISDLFFPDLNFESEVIVALNVVVLGTFFLTAAENVMKITEELCRRFLRQFYDSNSFIRRHEVSGWTFLSAMLIVTIFIPAYI